MMVIDIFGTMIIVVGILALCGICAIVYNLVSLAIDFLKNAYYKE